MRELWLSYTRHIALLFTICAALVFAVSNKLKEDPKWDYFGMFNEEAANVSYRDAILYLYSITVDESQDSRYSNNVYHYYGQFVIYDREYLVIDHYYHNTKCYLRWIYPFVGFEVVREIHCTSIHGVLVQLEYYP